MSNMTLKTLTLGSAAALFLAACATTPAADSTWIAFDTLEPGLPTNRALACDPDICLATTASLPSATYDVSAEAVASVLAKLEPGAEFRTEENGDIRARYVDTTTVLRFRDDVDVLIRPVTDNSARVAIYSRSRVGLSDLGKNAARIGALEKALATEFQD
jgi:uncharacterized protein (DUF1499 family)